MELLKLIEKIPATFWGVVVGSFFTIIGVVLTNLSNSKRLRIQLEHDRDLKKHERELTLRKEIYLAAAEAISAGLGVVGRLFDLNTPYDKIMEPFADKASSIAKVNVIANDDTIKAITIFMEELTGGLLRLSRKRIQLGAMKERMSSIQKQIDQSSIERDRMISLMKEYNLAGSSDSQRWSVIQQNYDFELKGIHDLSIEKCKLELELFSAQMVLAKECHSEIAILNKLVIPVIRYVRAELDLPFNELSYTQVIEDS